MKAVGLNLHLLKGMDAFPRTCDFGFYPVEGELIDSVVVAWSTELKDCLFAVRIVPEYRPQKKHYLEWLYEHWEFWAQELCSGFTELLVRTFPQRQLREAGFPVERRWNYHFFESEKLRSAFQRGPEEIFWWLDVIHYNNVGGIPVLESGFSMDEDGYTWSAIAVGTEKFLTGFEKRLLEEYQPDEVTLHPLTKEGMAAAYANFDNERGYWKEDP